MVFCEECRWFQETEGSNYYGSKFEYCNAPQNMKMSYICSYKSRKQSTEYKWYPIQKNRDNECEWFREKEKIEEKTPNNKKRKKLKE